MTTAIATMEFSDGREYAELLGLRTKGNVQRWLAQGQVVGTVAAATVQVDFEFNPDARDDWQPYVGITQMGADSGVASVDAGHAWVLLGSGAWEDNVGSLNRTVGIMAMHDYNAGGANAGVMNEPMYFGRINKGQQAKLSWIFEEIDAAVYNVSASGLLSDKPFLVPDYWRV